MILDGHLLPGDPLREVPLSALLGVSRGPIREAFRSLEEKGMVTVVKNFGVFVRTLDPEEADQIYEVRELLEAMIGAKAARLTSTTWARWWRRCARRWPARTSNATPR
ncbi:MAG: GntR family transcriptional regulator [Candidatus Protistobacter heckmanni]|nr:GntR family transcriptional regulator [Candidatus Protistobacter heckmanni]